MRSARCEDKTDEFRPTFPPPIHHSDFVWTSKRPIPSPHESSPGEDRSLPHGQMCNTLCTTANLAANVSVGSDSAVPRRPGHVCSTLNIRRDVTEQRSAASCQTRTLARLFDHLVGAGEQRRRNVEAERLGGFHIDHQLELDRSLDRKLARPCAVEDAIGIARRAPKIIGYVNSVGDQTAELSVEPPRFLTSGFLVVRANDFDAWYRSERAKCKWPSQRHSQRSSIGRPSTQSDAVRNGVIGLVRDGKWTAKDGIAMVRRLLVEDSSASEVPSPDTLARLVDRLHWETGESEFFRAKRARRKWM